MSAARIDAFWRQVVRLKKADCWLWRGGVDTNGYGIFQVHEAGIDERRRRSRRCHRIAFALHHNREPVGLICHKCDNPTCCNPHHLFEGTALDNSWDAYRKQRGRTPVQKLTVEQVREIQQLYPPPTPGKPRPRGRYRDRDGTPDYGVIAERYGVNRTTIASIANRKIWRHTL